MINTQPIATMTPELIALGKRAFACKGWRWMPGMLVATEMDERPEDPPGQSFWIESRIAFKVTVDRRYNQLPADREWWCSMSTADYYGPGEGMDITSWRAWNLPSLSDPPTLGGLLALVREAYGDPFAFVAADEHLGWRVWVKDRPITGWFKTEAETLVAALEAAP